jgi:hypothetical protein
MDGSQLDRLIVDALLKTNEGKELIKTSMNELSVLIRAINHNNRKIQSPSLPSNLEEAANKFAVFYDQGTCDGIAQDCFKAGAEWQKQHDAELIEIAYNDGITIGMTKQKEQMMKKAVECELYWDGDFLAIDLNMAALGYSERDKVRIIVCKNED